MIRGSLSVLSVTVLACGVIALQQPGAVRATPDLTSPKTFPNGCVSCHVKNPDGDHRLNVLLGKTHANAMKQVKSLPADCAKCHKTGSKVGAMETLLHKTHYGKGEKGEFAKKFAGQCLHCHQMDGKTGKVTLKSGRRNW